ncbi:MAG: S1C family serine protease [Capsulimonadaceae bacterium]
MATYYSTDWETVTTTDITRTHVRWGPAIGATALNAVLLVLIVLLFPYSGLGVVKDAVVYVDNGRGYGSGMVIDAKRGYVLTNRHVVMDEHTHQAYAGTYRLTLYRGTDHETQVEATLKDSDQEWSSDDPLAHDWAVLEIVGEQPHSDVHFGDSLTLHTGIKVVAYGFPHSGLDTRGCTQQPGAITGTDQIKEGAPYKWIKHNASLAGGDSGGPLTLEDGTVIGMNTAADIVKNGQASGNANYAIPSDVLKPVLDKYARVTFH